jgi:RNA ligase (TIGR02306 family)
LRYCFPISVLESHPTKKLKVHPDENDKKKFVLENLETKELIPLDPGRNLTQIIGIKKYETPTVGVNVFGGKAYAFPGFLRKSDQPRIQNLPSYPIDFADVEFEMTEKMEGTSVTIFWKDGKFGVCSRNFHLQLDSEALAVQVIKSLEWPSILEKYAKNVGIQGELIGPGIQGNIYKLKDYQYRVYDVYWIELKRYATPPERIQLLKDVGKEKDSVPILGTRKIGGLSVDQIVALADGNSTLYKVQKEGIVFKSMELVSGTVINFKAISNLYLLKQH